MFTGIVQAIGKVISFQRTGAVGRLIVDTGLSPDCLSLGDSIAVDGCCQTIAALNGAVCTFDTLHETLERTTFRDYCTGRRVNIEPALRMGDRLGGHLIQGHIDTVSQVLAVQSRSGDRSVTLRRPSQREFPVVEKGSIAIDGISLTVAKVGAGDFAVSIIPHTSSHTTLLKKKTGDVVNLENDIVGKYVQRLLGHSQPAEQHKSRITEEFLRENGF